MGHLSHIGHLSHLPHVFGQHRRRAEPPPAPTVTITDVVWLDNNHVRVSFSASVVTQDVGTWAGFTVRGMQANLRADVDPQTVELGFSEQVNVGDAWEVAAQPDWLVTLIGVPEVGTVS